MIRTLYLFKCDHCGKQETIEGDIDLEVGHPVSWGTIWNSGDRGDLKSFHFHSHGCYEAFEKEHPQNIDVDAAFYADDGWFKNDTTH